MLSCLSAHLRPHLSAFFYVASPMETSTRRRGMSRGLFETRASDNTRRTNENERFGNLFLVLRRNFGRNCIALGNLRSEGSCTRCSAKRRDWIGDCVPLGTQLEVTEAVRTMLRTRPRPVWNANARRGKRANDVAQIRRCCHMFTVEFTLHFTHQLVRRIRARRRRRPRAPRSPRLPCPASARPWVSLRK